jgi:hypothetical protein
MSGFKRKPLQEADDLTAALRSHAGDLPTATGQQLEPQGRAGESPKPKALPTVQINFNGSEDMARLIAEEAAKAGSTRRFIARLMRDAGFNIPDADLNPLDNRRRWTR